MAPGQQGCSRPPRSQHRRHNGRAAAGCRAERPRQKAVSLPPQKPQVHPGGGTSELAPLHRRDSGSQARGEGNGVRRETPPTPPCTCPRRRHTRAHVCTANPTQRKRREPSPAGVPGWSAARGKGGQETPHSPQRTGPSPPQGPQRLHIGAPRPQAPPLGETSQGCGTWAHTRTCTQVRTPGCTGHRCPTSWTAHHGNGVAPLGSSRHLKAPRPPVPGEAARTKAQHRPAWLGVRRADRPAHACHAPPVSSGAAASSYPACLAPLIPIPHRCPTRANEKLPSWPHKDAFHKSLKCWEILHLFRTFLLL